MMNAASSEQRNRTAPATSSGSPSRPSGVFCEHRAGRLLGQHVGQLRLDVAGRDDVGAHVAAAELAGERLREADDPRLRRSVVRLAPVAAHADDRGDVHDRARRASSSSRARRRGRCRSTDERFVSITVCQSSSDMRASSPSRVTPGVVDEDVEVARRLDQRSCGVRIGDVRLDGPAADLRGQRLGLLLPGAVQTTTAAPARASSARSRGRSRGRRPSRARACPSREQNAVELTDASASCALLQAREVLTEIVFTPRSMRLTRPDEHVSRADLDERRHAASHQLAGGLREPHRSGELVDEQRRRGAAPARSSRSPST